MESLLAIGVGLVLRIVVDVATENDNRVGGVLVGLWEGIVLNHFVRRMPHSFDPYLGFGFRIFVDFLFTQSISRLALVALWALVGMLLADIAPNVWRESGLRHIYRQVRKDVRHVKRSVPHIRIKNDLPSVRLFAKSRSASSSAGSIRSDRATPPRSPVPSRAPTPGPSRRPGPSPPGTFPDVSGWSETNSDVSNLRERVVVLPGPSPTLIPSREHAAYDRIDTTRTATSKAQAIKDTTITITRTEKQSVSLDTVVGATTLAAAASTSLGGPSRHTLPVIPDDWINLDHPTPTKSNEPVPPFKPDSDSAPEPPSTPIPSRPVTLFVPPSPIDILPDIDLANRVSQPPDQISLPESRAPSMIGSAYVQPQPRSALRDTLRSRVDKAASEVGAQIPLPESRAASEIGSTYAQPQSRSALRDTLRSRVDEAASEAGAQIPLPESRAVSEIGGIYDQPQPRSALRDSLRSRVDKAASEIGVDPTRSLGPIAETQSIKSQSTTRSWTSWARSKFGQSVDVGAPEPPPGEEPLQGRSEVGSAVQEPEPTTSTPAQVDPPPNILTQPGDTTPLLFTAEPEPVRYQEQPQPSKAELPPPSAGVDSSPMPPQDGPNVGDTAGPRKSSLFDLPSPSRSPPPPFTEFAGVPEDVMREGPAEQDPVAQDEEQTELTEEQKAAEEKRKAFLSTQAQELEGSRADLQTKLDKEDDPSGGHANAIQSDLEDAERTLGSIGARMAKKKFSEPPSDASTREVTLINKSVSDVQFAVTSAIMDMLLKQDHVGPMTLKVVVSKQAKPTKKAKDAKDAVIAFAKRHHFATQSENATPGTVHIVF